MKTAFFMAPIGIILSLASCAKDPPKLNLSLPHKADQLLISLQDLPSTELHQQALDMNGETVQVKILNERTWLLSFQKGSDLTLEAERLAALSAIKSIEPNVIYELLDNLPNDLNFAEMWGLHNKGQKGGLVGADIGALKAWESNRGNHKQVIGVIDTGIDYQHPDLALNIWKNPGETGVDADGQPKDRNLIDDDGNGFIDDWRGWDFVNQDNEPMDDHSHGTHVAGIMGAVGNNGRGIAGVSWSLSMVPIKVFSEEGKSTADLIIQGLDYASRLGVLATNNSWGAYEYSEAMYTAIQRAQSNKSLFIAAAGNDGSDNDVKFHFPSNYPLENIIAVAASNRHDKLAPFSNFGQQTVMVAAPGVNIFSTLPNGKYGYKSGTSMAAPHVTGLVALLAAQFPQLKPEEIKELILQSVHPSLESSVRYGRIDAAKALEQE